MNVSQKQHFVHAALFWMGVGSVLGFFGFKWILLGFDAPLSFVVAFVCAVIGLVKGEFAIGKSAKRAVLRIQSFSERTPFFKVFSKGQWVLILVMMSLGMFIRHLGIEKSYRGIVLAVVGIALLWGSKYFWRAACERS